MPPPQTDVLGQQQQKKDNHATFIKYRDRGVNERGVKRMHVKGMFTVLQFIKLNGGPCTNILSLRYKITIFRQNLYCKRRFYSINY